MSEHDFKEMISKMSEAGIKKNIQHQINMDVELYASKIRREIKKFKHFNKNLIKKIKSKKLKNVETSIKKKFKIVSKLCFNTLAYLKSDRTDLYVDIEGNYSIPSCLIPSIMRKIPLDNNSISLVE
jgi:hypothetical protein